MALISQREARRLQKRVRELETREHRRASYWSSEWPGVNIWTLNLPETAQIVEVVRKLGHAVVVTTRTNGDVLFYADRLVKE